MSMHPITGHRIESGQSLTTGGQKDFVKPSTPPSSKNFSLKTVPQKIAAVSKTPQRTIAMAATKAPMPGSHTTMPSKGKSPVGVNKGNKTSGY